MRRRAVETRRIGGHGGRAASRGVKKEKEEPKPLNPFGTARNGSLIGKLDDNSASASLVALDLNELARRHVVLKALDEIDLVVSALTHGVLEGVDEASNLIGIALSHEGRGIVVVELRGELDVVDGASDELTVMSIADGGGAVLAPR